MESAHSVFIVDDDKTIRLLLESMLANLYDVEVFDSAESCLKRLADRIPDLLLLDVGLPGMNGYELCRAATAMPECKDLHVVFLSGHDNPDDIMNGYDAGGQDYIVKPFDVVSLSRKIENILRIGQHKKSLNDQVSASDELVTLVLANLDEYAILIKFLRSLNECSSYSEIIESVLRSLDAFHLDGAVQIRMRNLERTISRAGENWPLEIAVINHIRTLDRIFEFRNRCSYNFDHITILVTNMPIENSDLCGRIRDHLAIAAESADAKLMALQSFEDNATMREDIRSILLEVGATVSAYGKRYDAARFEGAMYTTRFLDDLLASFAHLGMGSHQEDELMEMVKERTSRLIDLYDIAGETQEQFGALGKKLEAILVATSKA